ncbi:hypothetical protein PVAP13_3KG492001 [Panicum virgatum]|uniref:Ubiquitin-like protease family profile domain-containing protein n=1 Tax=Panicum virgatum TaxID=38727 RepID=A0A8T0V4C4_PANVG|nr:hypothetical protein PVAP13_3KG492001 [Panicum virgatum]
MKNTIVEIGIYVINGKKTRVATRRVLPLYVSVNPLHMLLQHNQSGMAAIGQVFNKETNHLYHKQMILFPVLQKLVEADEHSGHYFLIVLNLRNKRFEVLDSMRNLEDAKLADYCNRIINCIKSMWTIYYDGTNNPIEKYELVNIPVLQQKNKQPPCLAHPFF